MLNLIESRAARQQQPAAHAASVLAHAAIITAAVMATQHVASTAPVEPTERRVTYVAPVQARPAAPSLAVPEGFPLVVPPLVIPDVLPAIDLSHAITDPNDFYRAVGVAGGDPRGVSPDSVDAFPAFGLEQPARLVPGSASPVYPEILRAAGIQGDVEATFVIDPSGRADMRTFRILSSNHARFSESVTRAVASARFVPAEFGGRKVRQWVRMPFVFSIR